MSNPESLLLSGSGQPFVNSSITFNLTSVVPPSFTLGCISTSGPPTVVTWTRDGISVSMDGNHGLTQTLVNTVTATYYNNLTVNGILPGLYRCSITSFKPVVGERLSASQEVTIAGKCWAAFKSELYNYKNLSSLLKLRQLGGCGFTYEYPSLTTAAGAPTTLVAMAVSPTSIRVS